MAQKTYQNKHLVIVFWDLGIGGIQTRIRDITARAIEAGARVTILMERRSGQEITLVNNKKLHIYHFKEKDRNCSRKSFLKLSFFRFLWWLGTMTYKLEPTEVLVFLCRLSFFLVCLRKIQRFLGRDYKLVLNEGICTTKYVEQFESRGWKSLIKWSYPKADEIIVATLAVKRDLVFNFGVSENKIKVIRSWVNQHKEKRQSKQFDGLYVGRLSPEKGIKTIMKLAKLIKTKKQNYQLAIIGDGILREDLISEIKQWKLHKVVTYLGYQKHEQVLKKINESRLLLLPSINEGLPMTVLEAKSLGVPAVVKPFLGAEEVIIDGVDGVITKNSDINFILETEKLLEDKNKIEKMGREARKQVKKNFSKNNLEKFVDEVFKKSVV